MKLFSILKPSLCLNVFLSVYPSVWVLVWMYLKYINFGIDKHKLISNSAGNELQFCTPSQYMATIFLGSFPSFSSFPLDSTSSPSNWTIRTFRTQPTISSTKTSNDILKEEHFQLQKNEQENCTEKIVKLKSRNEKWQRT